MVEGKARHKFTITIVAVQEAQRFQETCEIISLRKQTA